MKGESMNIQQDNLEFRCVRHVPGLLFIYYWTLTVAADAN